MCSKARSWPILPSRAVVKRPRRARPGGTKIMAFRTHVLVCAGTGCVSGNSYLTAKAIEADVLKRHLAGEIQVVRTGCQGFCAAGPIVIVQPDGVFYCGVQAKDAPHLVEEHFLKGRPVKRLMY